VSKTPRNWTLSVKEVLQRSALSSSPALGVDGVPRDDIAQWREDLRKKLWDLLGGPGEAADPELETVMTVEEDGVSRSLLRYRSEPGVTTSAWLLRPVAPHDGPRPGFLALHGHGRGKDDVLGLVADRDTDALAHIADLNYDYATQLARRGFVVLAPDARGFGERAAGDCHTPGLVSLYTGRPIPGQRLWDDMCSLGILASLPDVDADRLGCGGLSEGGKRTLFLAALDERVRVAVVSGYFTSLRTEIDVWDRLAGWDICNAVPGLLAWADLPDIAALIAPRDLVIENGRQDPLYTLEGVVAGFRRATRAWELLGVPEAVELDLFDGVHEWSGRRSYAHIDRVLNPDHEGEV
jgi:dienelactone hydrolase